MIVSSYLRKWIMKERGRTSPKNKTILNPHGLKVKNPCGGRGYIFDDESMIKEFQDKLSKWLTYWEYHNQKQIIPIEVIATDYWYNLTIRPNPKGDQVDPRFHSVMGEVRTDKSLTMVELISNIPTPDNHLEIDDMLFALKIWMIQRGLKNG